ncbi:MAG: nucleotidyltransferase domain-containing protein [Thermotogaceae bacterium]|nr:nucleotidyltransferase domain-containing protein [Thermotogaceae bacterium]
MPVRSLNSSVLKWPNREEVINALKKWISSMEKKNILKVGYFGSYAKGNWGVGSDLDVVIIVERCDLPFEKRGTMWDFSDIPVPVDVFVYTEKEWEQMKEAFRDVKWMYISEQGQLDR